MYRFFFTVIAGFFLGLPVLSAQRIVTVVDAGSGEPLPHGTLVVTCLTGGCSDSTTFRMTDRGGSGELPFNHAPVRVEARFIGYVPAVDTLGVGESITMFLVEDEVHGNGVVVTGQAVPISRDRSVYNVRVIDREEIEDRSAQNLRDLMSGELNVRIDQDNILGAALRVGGLSGQHVRILVDGVPVVGRVGENIDPAQLPVADVERVEIIEGPLSVLYGTDALGGVVNLITGRPVGPSWRAEGGFHYESVGVWDGDLSVAGRMNSTVAEISGGRHYFAGFSDGETGRVKEWKPREQTFGKLKLKQYFGSLSLSLDSRIFDEYILNRGMPRAPYGETAFDDSYATFRLTNTLTATLPLNRRGGGLELVGAASFYRRQTTTFLKNLVTLEQTSNSSDEDISSVRAWNGRGVYHHTSLRDDAFFSDMQGGVEARGEIAEGDRIADGEKSVGEYAAFGTVALRPLARLTLRPGLRLLYNTRYDAPPIPSLNVLFSPAANVVLRGSWGRGFRSPSLRDLFFSFVDINHNIRGNEDLKAETSDNLSFSATWNRSQKTHAVEIGLNFFYNDVSDLITLANVEGDLYSYVNVGDFRSAGGTLTGEYRAGRMSGRVGIAAIGRDNGLSAGEGFSSFSFSPEVTVEADYIPFGSLKFSSLYKFTGPLSSYGLDDEGNLLERRVDGYHTLDLSAGYTLFDGIVTLRAGGKNLFDVTGVLSSGADGGAHNGSDRTMPVAWGRTFFVDLTLRMKGNGGER